MDIAKFGGEFKLIEAIVKKKQNNDNILVGAGDDAAVLKAENGQHQIISSDMFIDGNHFSTRFYEPLQIGKKIVEGSASDLVAMGGKTNFLLLSIGLKKQLKIAYVRSLYRGIYSACAKLGISLIGGDTIKSSKLVINATVIGSVSEKNLTLRSGAKAGDVIKISGHCGGSRAGLMLLMRHYEGHEPVKRMYLEPTCRQDIVGDIAPYATAMIDVSDGIGSEVQHIANNSNMGAEIFLNKIPIHKAVIHACRALKKDPLDFALYGGEDFQLLYTVSPQDADKVPGTVIGKIIDDDKKVYLYNTQTGEKIEMVKEGYKNF